MAFIRVILHTKAADHTGGCPWCDRAKAWLSERGIGHVVVEWSAAGRIALYDRLGLEGAARTVPQAMLLEPDGEEHRIGGYDALVVSGVESLFREGVA